MLTRWHRPVIAVASLLLPISALAPACGSNNVHSTGTGGGDAGSDAPAEAAPDAASDALMPPPITRTEGEATLAPKRQACGFSAGAWPADTLGTEIPVGTDIPINNVIVIIQENRSFDHYLGRLVAQGYYKPGDFTTPPGADGGTADAGTDPWADAGLGEGPGSGFAHNDQLDAPPTGWSNPDGNGGIVVPHPDTQYCFTSNHSWGAMHDDLDNGLLDHFVTQNNPGGDKEFFYEDDTVIPFYYALANTFGVGDRYFCSVLSSTWPNRYFAMAATSWGIGDNSFDTLDTPQTPALTIFANLEAGGHTWGDFTDGPHMTGFFPYTGFTPDTLSHLGSVNCDLLSAIQTGTLPDVSFMMGDEVTEDSDEGPSDLPGIGAQVVEKVIRTLFASPSWKDTAVFITYDENGGMADHVPPAPACAPDSYTPHDGSGNPLTPGGFDTTGFRVPFIVVSPYARAHFASHVVHDHTSILRFIEARFGLPAMTARDANATPPMEMFDFQSPPFATPPTITATTTVPPTILSQCNQPLAPLTCSQ
jgi:phospholipase C